MRSKKAQQTRESGDEALTPMHGTVSGKISYKPILHYAYSFSKENNSAINRLPFVIQDSRQNNVASAGPNRAVSLFEAIEAIIWKPKTTLYRADLPDQLKYF